MSWSDGAHPLAEMLSAAAEGSFPPVDGVVEVVPPDTDAAAVAIVEFTGHAVVMIARPADDPDLTRLDAFGGVSKPGFVSAIAPPGSVIGSHDAVLVRRGGSTRASSVAPLPESSDHEHHPRVARARTHRRDVCVYADERGLVTLGRGLVGRLEISVELTSTDAPPGSGRSLILGGLEHVDGDEFVWAQVAPGNAASLRAFLACGFVPIGSEILITQG